MKTTRKERGYEKKDVAKSGCSGGSFNNGDVCFGRMRTGGRWNGRR